MTGGLFTSRHSQLRITRIAATAHCCMCLVPSMRRGDSRQLSDDQRRLCHAYPIPDQHPTAPAALDSSFSTGHPVPFPCIIVGCRYIQCRRLVPHSQCVSDALGQLTLLPRGRARRVVESMLPLADVCPTQASALISLCRKCSVQGESKVIVDSQPDRESGTRVSYGIPLSRPHRTHMTHQYILKFGHGLVGWMCASIPVARLHTQPPLN